MEALEKDNLGLSTVLINLYKKVKLSDIEKFNYIIVGSSFAAHPIIQTLSENKKNNILVIEGGDTNENDFSEELTLNKEIGNWKDYEQYWAAHWIRAYGGTSRRWSGMCAPLEKKDFEGNENVPQWPINKKDLDFFYKKASRFLFRKQNICENQGTVNADIDYKPYSLPEQLKTFYDLNEDFLKNNNVSIMLNTHVIKLKSKDKKNIDQIIINQNNKFIKLKIKKQKIILCCGGLGNAQILLQNLLDEDDIMPWNKSILGKNLMEHPHHYVGHGLLSEDFVNMKPSNFGPFTNGFSLSRNIRTEKKLLNCVFEPRRTNQKLDLETQKIKLYYEKKFNKKLNFYKIFSRSEQSPNINSYVNILKEKNNIGLTKLEINFRIREFDKKSLYESTLIFGEKIMKNKIGVIRANAKEKFNPTFGGGHTMGTTKMGLNNKDSIVDKNCKVHGISNLYVSGSSVFTSGGAANPTLTIVALAYKLGYHLKNNV